MTATTQSLGPAPRVLVFGASGAIGGAIATHFAQQRWQVVGVSRSPADGPRYAEIVYNPMALQAAEAGTRLLAAHAPYDAVCWAQGRNATDNVFNVDLAESIAVYQANCLYILATLKNLLNAKLLAPSARLCVISSIWQNLARQDKLSYSISKAALQGLVLSASVDLGREGKLINAILPGPLDTPMTHRNLSADQLDKLSSATYFNRLASLDDVASLALYLCSPSNTGVTGQFIAADLGFSHARRV